MYERLSAAASTIGAPYARSLARNAMRLAAALAPATVPQCLQRKLMGLAFPGPIGLAAGFDKHGELYSCLPELGFGFAEIGSVTPQAEAQRSRGLDVVAKVVSGITLPHPIPLGVSISMNRATPASQMPKDYLDCMEKLWLHADYITINLGTRAGPDLHLPEHRDTLRKVLFAVKETQSQLTRQHGMQRPLLVKVDIGRGNSDANLSLVADHGFDGILISGEHNGCLGRSLDHIERMAACLPVISVGGIRTAEDAADRLAAGASLLQVYGALVTAGPMTPRCMNRALACAQPSG